MSLVLPLGGVPGPFGPSSLPIAIEVVRQGEKPLEMPIDSPTVHTTSGRVVIGVMEGFNSPGYGIRGKARVIEQPDRARRLRVEIVTEELEGNFVQASWFKRYRFATGSVPADEYGLQLTWRNDFKLPAYRFLVGGHDHFRPTRIAR